jgi:hypothetical protein
LGRTADKRYSLGLLKGKKHMRALILLALLATPSLCLALGVEQTFFVGVSSHGKLMWINVRDDYHGGILPYGSSEDPSFRYCGTVEHNFQCAKTPTERPTVIYKSGDYERDNDDPTKGTGIRYEEAMSYLKKAKANIKARVELYRYYICDQGCDDKKPLFIFDFYYLLEEP